MTPERMIRAAELLEGAAKQRFPQGVKIPVAEWTDRLNDHDEMLALAVELREHAEGK